MPQRVAAVGIVVVQALTLALLMNAYVFPICITILAFVNLFVLRSRWQISLPGDRWVFVIAALLILKYYFAPQEIPVNSQFIFSSFSYEVAAFSLVLEILLLYRKENTEKIPIGFLACAVIGFVFTGNIRLNQFRRVAMLILVQVFLFCWMMFSAKSRRVVPANHARSTLWRTSVMIGVLLFSATLGTTASIMLHQNERALEAMLAAYLEIGDRGPARSGFSNRGGLSDVSSWRDFGGDRLALRVESVSMPGYLRGKVFDEFHSSRWTMTNRSQRLIPSTSPEKLKLIGRAVNENEHLYLVDQRIPEKHFEMKVWPIDNETAGHCFAPLNTSAIICRSRPVGVDQSHILTRPSENNIVGYTLLVNPVSQIAEDSNFDEWLQIPANLDEHVLQAAEKIYSTDQSPLQKMKATEKFFHQNFKYQMGIRIPRGEDPLGFFLESRSAAHCEFFATASVILLRLTGVPARYVTGFYAQEQNSLDKSWVARRKDAHAWVEAYDSVAKKWVLVESTPSEGLPMLTQVSPWQHRKEAVTQFFRTLQDNLSSGNYTQVVWMIIQPVLWLLAIMGLGGVAVWLLSHRIAVVDKSEIRYEEFHTELILERKLMDRELEKQGVRRNPDETTTQFSKRLETTEHLKNANQFSRWYQEYSACRFRPGYSVQQLEELRLLRNMIQESNRQQRGASSGA